MTDEMVQVSEIVAMHDKISQYIKDTPLENFPGTPKAKRKWDMR